MNSAQAEQAIEVKPSTKTFIGKIELSYNATDLEQIAEKQTGVYKAYKGTNELSSKVIGYCPSTIDKPLIPLNITL